MFNFGKFFKYMIDITSYGEEKLNKYAKKAISMSRSSMVLSCVNLIKSQPRGSLDQFLELFFAY